MTKRIYLASPYTHLNPKIMKRRFVQVCKVAGILTKKGEKYICPIASSCPIAKYGKIKSTTWSYWADLDLDYMSVCTDMYISILDKEWVDSVGMKAEFEYAVEHGMPVKLITRRGKVLNTSIEEIKEMFENKREVLYV